MNRVIKSILFFVLTLFWGLIGLHSVSGLFGPIFIAFSTGVSAEGALLIEKALKTRLTKEDWKLSLYSLLGIVVSIIVIFALYYSPEGY